MTAPLARPAAFRGLRFPPDLITVAVRSYRRYNLSYRDLEELLVERGVQVDLVTIHRWVRRFTPLFIDAARNRRLPVGRRWHVDETYIRVGGVWRYLYRAIDGHGQVVDVLLSEHRDTGAARSFFLLARSRTTGLPEEVVTDRAPVYPGQQLAKHLRGSGCRDAVELWSTSGGSTVQRLSMSVMTSAWSNSTEPLGKRVRSSKNEDRTALIASGRASHRSVWSRTPSKRPAVAPVE